MFPVTYSGEDFLSPEYLRDSNSSNLSDSDDLSSLNSFVSRDTSQTSFCKTEKMMTKSSKEKNKSVEREEEVSIRKSVDKIKIHEDIHHEKEEKWDNLSSKSEGDSSEDSDDIESSKTLSLKESIPAKDPTFVPRHSGYFLHDDRLGEEMENETPRDPHAYKSTTKVEKRWEHDLFDSFQQVPKSSEELIDIYGYDIRTKDEISLNTENGADDLGKNSRKIITSIGQVGNYSSSNRNTQKNRFKEKRPLQQYKKNDRFNNNVSVKQNKFDDSHRSKVLDNKNRMKRDSELKSQIVCLDTENNVGEYLNSCHNSYVNVSGILKNVPVNLNLRHPKVVTPAESIEVLKVTSLSEDSTKKAACFEEKKAPVETKYFYNKHMKLNDFEEKERLRKSICGVPKLAKNMENSQQIIPLTYEQFLTDIKLEWDKEQAEESPLSEVATAPNFQSESYGNGASEDVQCFNSAVDLCYGKEIEQAYVNENCPPYEKPTSSMGFSGYIADSRLVEVPNFDNYSSVNPPQPQCYSEFIEVEQPPPVSYIYPYQQLAFIEPREAATPPDVPFFYFLEQPQSQHYFTPQRPMYRPVGIGRGRLRSPVTSSLYTEPEFVQPSHDFTPASHFDIVKHPSYSADYVQQRFISPMKEIEAPQRYWAFRDCNQNEASGFIFDVCSQQQASQQPGNTTKINERSQILRQAQDNNIIVEGSLNSQTCRPQQKFVSRYCKKIPKSGASDKSNEVCDSDNTNEPHPRRLNSKRYSVQRLKYSKPSDG